MSGGTNKEASWSDTAAELLADLQGSVDEADPQTGAILLAAGVLAGAAGELLKELQGIKALLATGAEGSR